MRKNGLQALCRHFGLDNDGPVITLRQTIKTHLRDNHAQLANNAIYTRLYPRGPGRQKNFNLPSDKTETIQTTIKTTNHATAILLLPLLRSTMNGMAFQTLTLTTPMAPSVLLPSRHGTLVQWYSHHNQKECLFLNLNKKDIRPFPSVRIPFFSLYYIFPFLLHSNYGAS